MKTDIAFKIDIPGYSVHQLLPEDSQIVQGLFERCLDYMLLVDGHPAPPNAAENEFQDIPAGYSLCDKVIIGILNQQGELIGLLDALRGYPAEATWWIGLLLLEPAARSQGIGQEIVRGFAKFVQTVGGQALMLGVVEENTRAYNFWEKMGFEFVRKTEPRKFGLKLQSVLILCLPL